MSETALFMFRSLKERLQVKEDEARENQEQMVNDLGREYNEGKEYAYSLAKGMVDRLLKELEQ